MLILAILMRPIILLTDVPGKILMRVLADDVILVGLGAHNILEFCRRFTILITYIIDMGSVISIKKSFLFSSNDTTRDWLRNYFWEPIKENIRVVTNFRDLGAHLNLSGANNGATLAARLRNGVAKAMKIRKLPHDYATKAMFVLTSVLSGSLYGCEATYASESAMDALATAIADTVSPRASKRSNDIMFSTLMRELEPCAVVFMRRAITLRRMIAKQPFVLEFAKDILDTYCTLGYPGTCNGNLTCIPARGTSGRRAWKNQYMARGPIGFLILSAAEHGMSIDDSWNFTQAHEPSLNLVLTPDQFLPSLLRVRICNNRSVHLASSRSSCHDSAPIDFDLLRHALSTIKDADTRRIVSWRTNFSAINNHVLHGYGQHHVRSVPPRIHDVSTCKLTHSRPAVAPRPPAVAPQPPAARSPVVLQRPPRQDLPASLAGRSCRGAPEPPQRPAGRSCRGAPGPLQSSSRTGEDSIPKRRVKTSADVIASSSASVLPQPQSKVRRRTARKRGRPPEHDDLDGALRAIQRMRETSGFTFK